MRLFSLALIFGCLSAPAFADELTDAQKLWDSKQFSAAFAAFSKLAAAGNANAQLQLGEMYGFGEGTPEDLGQARSWLDKAAKAGHPEAANSLALVEQRAARKADIAYYVSKFDGGSARYERFNCKRPELPDVSTSRSAIKKVNESIKDWRTCYEGFADNLNRVATPQQTIPADVLNVMNNEEFKQASQHIAKTYEDISNNAQKEGEEFYKNINNWMTRTTAYLEKSRESNDPDVQRLMAENQVFSKSNLEVIQSKPASNTTRRK